MSFGFKNFLGASLLALSVAAPSLPTPVFATGSVSAATQQVVFRTESIDGLNIAYREAGDPSPANDPAAARLPDIFAHVSEPHS